MQPTILIRDPSVVPAVAKPSIGVAFDEDDIEILKDFLEPKKLAARQLRRTEDGGIIMGDDRRVAAPGFVELLERIVERR